MKGITFTFAAAILAAATAQAAESDTFSRDRQAILSMAGEYQVSFEFEEVLTLTPEGKKSPRHLSRGHEKVIIVADEEGFISLQHLLLVGEPEDPHVIKHWRQDWQYEPENILSYQGNDTWAPAPVEQAERTGAWAQTVFQVDDSPRYAGTGRWRHIGNHSFWESGETWRPLPRREKEKRDDYDLLAGKNRHSITPEGWAHEQDNLKLGLSPERVLGREHGQNTYRSTRDFDFSKAEQYWRDTQDFWGEVRAMWDARIQTGAAIHLGSGKGLEPHLEMLELAEQYAAGEYNKMKAITERVASILANSAK
jgi:hypothetical protein